MSRYDNLIEDIKKIDVDKITNQSEDIKTEITEEQKVYDWFRLYLTDEVLNIIPGDDIQIEFITTNEKLKTKFLCYDKNYKGKNDDDNVVLYDSEDNKKILCLLVNMKDVNNNEAIPFIRTLFKTSIHYTYQMVRRSDLIFTNLRTNEILEYYECSY